jgi:hypothetical protein
MYFQSVSRWLSLLLSLKLGSCFEVAMTGIVSFIREELIIGKDYKSMSRAYGSTGYGTKLSKPWRYLVLEERSCHVQAVRTTQETVLLLSVCSLLPVYGRGRGWGRHGCGKVPSYCATASHILKDQGSGLHHVLLMKERRVYHYLQLSLANWMR